ncbi:MAG: hypothetical protein QW775_03845 [Ignisphaera sp.]|uniref:Uncharacterized protein n=1 Tax=Ignisphaera aggregans TaxID=334771 RepID=A0A7C4NLS1_9CREN
MKNSATAVLEYLILKVLADKKEVLRALYDYFVDSTSPSTIANKYGLSKHQIRGYVQRIMEKTGSSDRAKVLMKYTIPVIIKIKPIAKKVNGSIAVCALCNEELPLQVVEDHIKKKHSNIVSECLDSVVEVLKKVVTTKNVT